MGRSSAAPLQRQESAAALVGMTMLEMVEPKSTARNHPRKNPGMEQSWLCHYAALKHTCEAPIVGGRPPFLCQGRQKAVPTRTRQEGRGESGKLRRSIVRAHPLHNSQRVGHPQVPFLVSKKSSGVEPPLQRGLKVVEEELGYAGEDYAARGRIGDWVAAAGGGDDLDIFAMLD
jgi:hypothetical protein